MTNQRPHISGISCIAALTAAISSDRGLLLIGAVLCVVAAWFTLGYHHPDEHFQIWEFANHKLGRIPASDLPWEFAKEMRPGLQPLLAYGVVRAAAVVGIDNPFLAVFATRLLCGLAVVWVYWNWSKWLERDLNHPDAARWLRIGLLFFWFMPYLQVRSSSESTSALCFFGGLLLLLRQAENREGGFGLKWVAAGFLLGISFFFRYQIAFAGIGLAAWLIFHKKMGLTQWSALLTGMFLAVGAGIAADYWLYGHWVCPPYQYFVNNFLESEDRFGTEPWWWYFQGAALGLLPPLSIALMVFLVVGIWQKPGHVLSWCFAPFLLGHLMFEHKEMRFLFPMILPFFFLSVTGWAYWQEKFGIKKWAQKTFSLCLWVNAFLLLFWVFSPAKGMAAYSKFLWDWHEKHRFSTVYFVKEAPREHYPLNMPFYEHPGQIQRSWYTKAGYVNDTTALRPGDLMFFTDVLMPPPAPPPGFKLERVYAYYPDWLLHFNANNWQNRTRIWAIYVLGDR